MENYTSVETPQDVAANKEFYDRVLSLALKIGSGLMSSGCPVSRVEVAVEYICSAYGAKEVYVFALPSMIIASFMKPDGGYLSQMKRVLGVSNNFLKMERLNQLSRDICKYKYEIEDAEQKYRDVNASAEQPPLLTALSGGLAAGAFAMSFGNLVIDAIPAAIIGGLMAYLNMLLSRLAFNGYARTFMLSIIGGFLSILFSFLLNICGVTCNCANVIIGTIMIVIPGLSICNAVRDLFAGDLLSGSFQMINGILTTLAIAAGYAIPLITMGKLVYNPVIRMDDVSFYVYLTISYFICSCGFTIMFNSGLKRLLSSMINIAVTLAVYIVMQAFVPSPFTVTLVSTIVATILSEVLARLVKAPSTIMLVPAIMAFVPGGMCYYAMAAIVSGDAATAAAKGTTALLVFLGIAVGIILVTAIFQLINPSKYRRILRRKLAQMKKNNER